MKTKRIVSILLSLCLIIGMAQFPVSAFTSGVFEYSINNGEVTITGCDTTATGELVIPAEINGYPVTSIGENAFKECKKLTSITIPDGVTSIGESAFWGCYILTSITIPDGVTSIGDSAFSCCGGLISIAIPDSVTSIGNGAFSSCSGLISITIPDSVTSIGNSMFSGCNSLTSITIPAGVTSIDSKAFAHCRSLVSIIIPDSVTSIGNCAFEYCSSLTSITIPSGITSIGYSAFEGCSSLTSITIPDSITSIGQGAFSSCSSLTAITIPDGVTSIGYKAFNGCNSLTDVNYKGTEADMANISIGSDNEDLTNATWHYEVCNSDKHVYDNVCDTTCNVCGAVRAVPGHIYDNDCDTTCNVCGDIREVPRHVYDNDCDTTCNACGDVREVPGHVYDDDADTICNECGYVKTLKYSVYNGGVAITDCDTTATGELVIPAEIEGYPVTSIGYSAFYGCSSLTSITIPAGVTSIGDDAFYGCSSLTSITIPDSVTSIGERAFWNCSSLTTITIPAGVTSIGNSAFGLCSSLTDVNYKGFEADRANISISAGNANLTNAAWHYNVCDSDKHVYDNNCDATCNVCGAAREVPGHVYDNDGDAICNECGYVKTLKYSVYNGGVAITGCDTLITEVVIPATIGGYSVTRIDSRAFDNCRNLISITIPDSVTSIGNGAFSGCSSLTSITIPAGVTSIGDYAFSGCSSLTSITIPDSVTIIGNYAFWNCSSLTSITIPDSVTSIGDYAFSGCSSLTSITIPAGVISIGEGAFLNCSSLTSITIPACVTSIGDDAFSGCKSLTAIDVSEGNQKYKSIDGVLFNKSGEMILQYPAGKGGTCTIPDGVTSIGYDAFNSCIDLTSIIISDSVTSIGAYAFSGCSSLTDVNYKGTEADRANISISAGNEYLTNATWHYKVCDSDKHVYDNNCDATCNVCGALREVPGHVYDNDADAICNECGYVKTLKYKINNGGVTITDCDTTATGALVIPAEIGGYPVTSIGDYAFSGCSSLISITIPAGVTSIGNNAFSGCSSLTDVNYKGTEADRANISISAGNEYLTNATWHYEVCDSDKHVYDNGCDTTCNVCGDVRAVTGHVYDNDADAVCNECGYERTIIQENAPAFVVENKTAKVGDTFTVEISTQNNTGIISLKLMVGYDADALELIGIEGKDFDGTSFGPISKNPIAVNWEDAINPNNTTNGTVAVLTFKVKEDATVGDTSITVTYDQEDVYDSDFENVTFEVVNGNITVIDYISGDVNGDGNINNKDLGLLRQYLNGWDVTIDVNASDVTRDGNLNNKDLGILRQYLNGWDVTLK